MTFTLQEISKKLELIVGAIMSSHLVYQDWQISTGHLQYTTTYMWLEYNSVDCCVLLVFYMFTQCKM